jgi:hypothetical protein
MALFRWRGDGAGTKTDWNDGRNWIDATGAAYAVGIYPGSTVGTHDDALFDAALTGTQQAMTGYDGSALEKLLSLRVSANYDGVFGDVALPLTIPATLAIVDAEAVSGTAYLLGAMIDTLLVTAGTVNVQGDVLNAYFLKGTVTATCSWGLGGTLVVGYETLASDATLTIPAGTGCVPVEPVRVFSGALVSGVDIPQLLLSAGTASLGAGCSVEAVVTGGILTWAGGDMDTCTLFGGSLATTVRTPQTVSVLTVAKGATANLDNGVGNITVTDSLNLGGTIVYAVGV